MDLDVGLAQVEQRLHRFFMESKLRAAAQGPSYLQLWEALERTSRGGSRSRPRLVLLAYSGLGGTAATEATGVAAAFELLHNALLVHDDVIDRDLLRRGSPNVAATYRNAALQRGASPVAADHAGACAAILAGDLALAGVYQVIRSLPISEALHRELHCVVDQAIFASVGGELFDIESSLGQDMPPLEEILNTARHKTSAYSFEAPLHAGAILAGAPEQARSALASFGRFAGIAYQIADDVLGVFGEQSQTGKSRWGDLREGKRTILLSYAATQPQWDSVAGLIGTPQMTASEAEKIRAMLIACGAKDYAIASAVQHAEKALGCLAIDEIPDRLRERLGSLLMASVNRVHLSATAV